MPYKDKQRRLEYWRDYRARTREHRKLLQIEWVKRNRAAWEEYQKAYRLAHRERRNSAKLVKARAMRAADPVYQAKMKRRAEYNILSSPTGYISTIQRANNSRMCAKERKFEIIPGEKRAYSVLWEKKHFVCYYCKKRKPVTELHMDHVFPLAMGGKHAVENLARSCVRCNLRKQDKFMEDLHWLPQKLLQL